MGSVWSPFPHSICISLYLTFNVHLPTLALASFACMYARAFVGIKFTYMEYEGWN